jgi:hypothetical protein
MELGKNQMKLLHWLLAGLSFGALFGKDEKHELPEIEQRVVCEAPDTMTRSIRMNSGASSGSGGITGAGGVTLRGLRVSGFGTVTQPVT